MSFLQSYLCFKAGPPTLYVKVEHLTPHTIQFSWNGLPYDYIDYFMVTIRNGTDVLKINTTELQANATPACGVAYECSVAAVNVVGEGVALTANYTASPCSTVDTISMAWTDSSAQPSTSSAFASMMKSSEQQIEVETVALVVLLIVSWTAASS